MATYLALSDDNDLRLTDDDLQSVEFASILEDLEENDKKEMIQIDDDDVGGRCCRPSSSLSLNNCLTLKELILNESDGALKLSSLLRRFRKVEIDGCRGKHIQWIVDAVFDSKNIESFFYKPYINVDGNDNDYYFYKTEFDGDDDSDDKEELQQMEWVLSALCRGLQTKYHGLKQLRLHKLFMFESFIQTLFNDGINQSLLKQSYNDSVPFLQSLDLSYCAFEYEDDDVGHGKGRPLSVTALCHKLRENIGLQELSIKFCGLSDQDMADIVRSVSNHPTLKKIEFEHDSTGPEVVTALVDLISAQQRPAKTAGKDDEEVRTPPPSTTVCGCLEHLHLTWHGLEHSFSDIDRLFEALEQNAYGTYLKSLHLRGSRPLPNSQVSAVVNALTVSQSLEDLRMEWCSLNMSSMEEILRNLHRYPKLTKLWLLGNEMKNTVPNPDVSPDSSDPATTTVYLPSDFLPGLLEKNHVLRELNLGNLDDWIQNEETKRQIQYYLLLNRAGRQFLFSKTKLPLGVWPTILERVPKLFENDSSSNDDSDSEHTTGNEDDETEALSSASREEERKEGNNENKIEKPFGGMCEHSTWYYMLQGRGLCERFV